jgi:hypothetical protein
MKLKYSHILLREFESKSVAIVNDAFIASEMIGDGRMIPLVIIDTSTRPDIYELAKIQKSSPSGDVEIQWGVKDKRCDSVLLMLRFKLPAELTIILEFDIQNHGGFIDQILSTQALYIQPGKQGDRISTSMNSYRILIEVPDTGFTSVWQDLCLRKLARTFRQKGLKKKDSKIAAINMIGEWRKIFGFKMKSK